jgi:hypothetical protein
MSVAMAVTSGRADVGLGIMAAKALDLDFIPVSRRGLVAVRAHKDSAWNFCSRSSAAGIHRQVQRIGGYEVEAETSLRLIR